MLTITITVTVTVVTELTLHCQTTKGAVKRTVVDEDEVNVSCWFWLVGIGSSLRAQRSTSFQLSFAFLVELPPELFLLKNVTRLKLYNNSLSTLPSGIAKLTKLERLWVRVCEAQRWLVSSPK
jgi:hypothetical protein